MIFLLYADKLVALILSANSTPKSIITWFSIFRLTGKAAGYIRNTEMAKNADALVAFWNGQSLGTKHMIATAEQLGLSVLVVEYKV